MINGWINKKRRTIINLLVNSPKGTMFMKSIDAPTISKIAEKVFEMLDNVRCCVLCWTHFLEITSRILFYSLYLT